MAKKQDDFSDIEDFLNQPTLGKPDYVGPAYNYVGPEGTSLYKGPPVYSPAQADALVNTANATPSAIRGTLAGLSAGLVKYPEAAGVMAGQSLTGQPTSWSGALDLVQQQKQQDEANHPYAYYGGNIAGGVGLAALTGGATAGTTLAPVSLASQVGRAALTGGGIGAVSGYTANRGDVTDMRDAVTGAIAGGALGPIATTLGYGGKKVLSAAATSYISPILGKLLASEDPADVARISRIAESVRKTLTPEDLKYPDLTSDKNIVSTLKYILDNPNSPAASVSSPYNKGLEYSFGGDSVRQAATEAWPAARNTVAGTIGGELAGASFDYMHDVLSGKKDASFLTSMASLPAMIAAGGGGHWAGGFKTFIPAAGNLATRAATTNLPAAVNSSAITGPVVGYSTERPQDDFSDVEQFLNQKRSPILDQVERMRINFAR